jgi:hypothetical protein
LCITTVQKWPRLSELAAVGRLSVRDRDESVAAAERLGASIISTADTGWTRSADVRDP